MAGNIGLQILRGSKEFDPSTSDKILKDGQLFYSKKNEQLYIGDGVKQLKDLEGTAIGLNLKNNISAGTGSLWQLNQNGVNSSGKIITTQAKASGNTATALGIATTAAGDGSFSSGYSSKAYTKADAAFNSAAQAGLTESEWNLNYPDNYIDSNVVYTYNDPRLVWGSFAANQSKAKGRFSAAFGSGQAWGKEAFALGTKSSANGDYSFASGIQCQSNNKGSFSGGRESKAVGDCSLAFGQTNQALGDRSITLGQGNICENLLSIAIGESNRVSSINGIALGLANTINGTAAFSAGSNNISNGYASATLGKLLIADADKQTVVGLLNKPLGVSSKAYFVVGNGDDNTSERSNAFVVFGNKAAKSYLEPKEDNDILRWQEKTQLEGQIIDEVAARDSADINLQKQINVLEESKLTTKIVQLQGLESEEDYLSYKYPIAEDNNISMVSNFIKFSDGKYMGNMAPIFITSGYECKVYLSQNIYVRYNVAYPENSNNLNIIIRIVDANDNVYANDNDANIVGIDKSIIFF